MTEDSRTPSEHELERLGVYDPDAPDAPDHLELIRYVMHRGATLEEVMAETSNLASSPST
jgi:ribosomal protein S16